MRRAACSENGRRAIGVVAAMTLSACTTFAAITPSPLPSEAEARGHLAQIVALARAGEFEALCDLGSGNCEQALDDAGRDAVPPAAPLVVGTRRIEPERLDSNLWSGGGFVLQVCGIDGAGRPYSSDVLVFRDGDRLLAIEAVYWAGIRIASGSTVGAATTPFPGCPT